MRPSERPAYSVIFDRRAWDEIMALDEKMQRRIFAATDALEIDPRPSDAKKLKGEDGRYRVRVGDFRILYTVQDDVLIVVVVEVGNRREIYKKR